MNIGHLQFTEAVSGRRVPCRLPGTWLLSSGVSSPLGTSARHAKQKNTQPQPELGNQAPAEIRSGKKLQWGRLRKPCGDMEKARLRLWGGRWPCTGHVAVPRPAGSDSGLPRSLWREGCAHGLPGGAACGQHERPVSLVLLAEEDLSKLPSADPGEGSGEPAQAC